MMLVHNHGTEEGEGLACRTQLIGKCVSEEIIRRTLSAEERAMIAEEKLAEITKLVKCIDILNMSDQDPVNDFWIDELTEIVGEDGSIWTNHE